MSTFNEINDNINELILQKSFDKLTPEEQVKAIAYAGSEEEYNQLRTTLLAITSSFNDETEEMVADVDTKKDLMARFESKYGSQNNRVKIVPIYRKPMFQLAVAASLTLIIFFTFPIFNNRQQEGQLAENKSFAEETGTATARDEAAALSMNTDSQPAVTPNANNSGETAISTNKPENTLAEETAQRLEMENKEAENFSRFSSELAKENQNKYYKSPVPENKKTVEEDVAVAPAKSELRADESLSFSDASWKNVDITTEKSAEKDNVDSKLKERKKSKDDGITDRITTGATQKNSNAGLTTTTLTTVSAFVETNKTEMIDLLFTVY